MTVRSEVAAIRVERWECLRRCGYYRCWTPRFAVLLITHPLYGIVSNKEAAQLDIENHDCNTYREALARRHGSQAEAAGRKEP